MGRNSVKDSSRYANDVPRTSNDGTFGAVRKFYVGIRSKAGNSLDFHGGVSFEQPPARKRPRLVHVDAIRVTACISSCENFGGRAGK